MAKGCLISFEGLDGAGKTTQLALLEQWLQERSLPYLCTREPGGTPLGVEIRQLLLSRPELKIMPLAEAFLFQADRAQHFASVVLPALEKGMLVVTDRCFDSSIAYQGIVRGVGADLVEQLSLLATQGRTPDLTVLLDLDSEAVSRRTDSKHDHSGLREQQNRFDQESLQFHQRLREAFLSLAEKHRERIHVLDASQSVEAVHRQIVLLVEQMLR